jgi:hypothetical protein
MIIGKALNETVLRHYILLSYHGSAVLMKNVAYQGKNYSDKLLLVFAPSTVKMSPKHH